MKEEDFLEAIEEKERKDEGDSTVQWGQWKGKSVLNWYRYSPLDECPRCGEYKLAHYTYHKGSLMGNKYLRGKHCRNCEYTDEVDEDPTRKLTDGSFWSSEEY
ncbi:hypothetical protein [Halolamina salina]|uniref:Uncharacterized protein n=1 Tax=Halolamina salina TaxID=1220023 RepID=A0ABD6B359_9EURY